MKKIIKNQAVVLIAAIFISMQIIPFVFAEPALTSQPATPVAEQSLEQALVQQNGQEASETPQDPFLDNSPIAACPTADIRAPYADQLREALGSDYSIEVTYAHATSDQPIIPGDFLRVTVTRLPKDLRPGEFRGMTIILNSTGKEVVSVLSVRFDGMQDVDGNLLYDALSQLNDLAKPSERQENTATSLSRVRIFNIDKDGSLDFTFNGSAYHAYRDKKKGEVVVREHRIPRNVSREAAELQAQLGTDYSVRVVPQFERGALTGYRVEATYLPKVITPGHVRTIEITFDKQGNKQFTNVRFDKMKDVDWKLLLAAVGDWGSLSRLTVSHIEGRVIYFTLDKINYSVYRAENGKVILKVITPSSVQKYADKLQSELGSDYSVLIVPQYSTKGVLTGYSVQALYLPKALHLGALRSVAILFDREGNATGLVDAQFDGFKKVDGNLLFEALGADRSAVLAMSRLVISSVDQSGVIFFKLDGARFAAYRGENGKVILKKLK